MSRIGIQHAHAGLRAIQSSVNDLTPGEAIATIDQLTRALKLALDAIDRIDMIPTTRSYTVAMQPVTGVSRAQVDQHIANLARQIYLAPIQRST